MHPDRLSLVALAACLVLLVVAFWQPILTARFDLQLPPLVEQALEAFDKASSGVDKAKDLLRDLVTLGDGRTRPAGGAATSSSRAQLRNWMVAKAKIPEGDQYLLGIISGLFRGGDVLLGLAIALFSVGLPIVKLTLGAAMAAGGHVVDPQRRPTVLRWLMTVGKWSMADVFMAAMVVVFFKAEGFNYAFIARPGLFAFGAAALLSSVVIGRLVKRELRAQLLALEGALRGGADAAPHLSAVRRIFGA